MRYRGSGLGKFEIPHLAFFNKVAFQSSYLVLFIYCILHKVHSTYNYDFIMMWLDNILNCRSERVVHGEGDRVGSIKHHIQKYV